MTKGDPLKEPTNGAVVIDGAGYAWQQVDGMWHLAAGPEVVSWDDLTMTYGPITVLFEWSWDT